jgi:hypothetical protein
LRPGASLIDPVVAVINVGQIFGRNTDAGVPNDEFGTAVFLRQPHHDLAARGRIFNGVIYQVEDKLFEPVRVAQNTDLVHLLDANLNRLIQRTHLAINIQEQGV